eukprot:TRINITY_DN5804_c0_g1_i2.p1 TRINITY_DN5804_c0_g1~~TRINITY_DN5804_c0_g1_i2.p1  ORF type:complete len:359 (-),score=64.71 TRINITY_DN5804_c0_g1_i2:171-1247(-)
MLSLFILCLFASLSQGQYPVGLNPEILIDLTNAYRNQYSLSDVPISKALMSVGSMHAKSMVRKDASCASCPGDCGLHSWSESISTDENSWRACCYPRNNSYPECMWDKPRQITKTWTKPYKGDGFENAVWIPGPPMEGTEQKILLKWKASKSHNDVILNREVWSTIEFGGVGAGLEYDKTSNRIWAFLWFGLDVDTNSYIRMDSLFPSNITAINNNPSPSNEDSLTVIVAVVCTIILIIAAVAIVFLLVKKKIIFASENTPNSPSEGERLQPAGESSNNKSEDDEVTLPFRAPNYIVHFEPGPGFSPFKSPEAYAPEKLSPENIVPPPHSPPPPPDQVLTEIPEFDESFVTPPQDTNN